MIQVKRYNREWKNFARENNLGIKDWGLGSNYLDIAKNIEDDSLVRARRAINGIRAVIKGKRDVFSLNYSCHSPKKKRWFRMKVKPFKNGVLIIHENISWLLPVMLRKSAWFKKICSRARKIWKQP